MTASNDQNALSSGDKAAQEQVGYQKREVIAVARRRLPTLNLRLVHPHSIGESVQVTVSFFYSYLNTNKAGTDGKTPNSNLFSSG